MNSRIGILLIRHLLLIVLCSGIIGGSADAALRGSVIANGGARTTAPNLVSYGTVGQAMIGMSTGGNVRLYQGYWTNAGSPLVGVDPPKVADLPVELSIGPAFPNPSRDAVKFALALPRAARVRLEVFDVAGRSIGKAVDREFDAGYQQITWQTPARATGVFFARLSVDGTVVAERDFVFAR